VHEPHTKSNPNPAAKQHAVVIIQLNLVTCSMYPKKFIRDSAVAPFLLLSGCHCYSPYLLRHLFRRRGGLVQNLRSGHTAKTNGLHCHLRTVGNWRRPANDMQRSTFRVSEAISTALECLGPARRSATSRLHLLGAVPAMQEAPYGSV